MREEMRGAGSGRRKGGEAAKSKEGWDVREGMEKEGRVVQWSFCLPARQQQLPNTVLTDAQHFVRQLHNDVF